MCKKRVKVRQIEFKRRSRFNRTSTKGLISTSKGRGGPETDEAAEDGTLHGEVVHKVVGGVVAGGDGGEVGGGR